MSGYLSIVPLTLLYTAVFAVFVYLIHRKGIRCANRVAIGLAFASWLLTGIVAFLVFAVVGQ